MGRLLVFLIFCDFEKIGEIFSAGSRRLIAKFLAFRIFSSIVGNPLICGGSSYQSNCSAVSLDPLSFPPDELKSTSPPPFSPPGNLKFQRDLSDDPVAVFCSPAQPQPGGAARRSRKVAVTFGAIVGSVAVAIAAGGLLLWWRHRRHQQIFFDVNGGLLFFFLLFSCFRGPPRRRR